MATTAESATSTAERELVITRVFDAPRALVFQCWSDPNHLAHWPGPRGFTATPDTFDCRPGGAYRTCLHGPDGRDHWVRGTYLEVAEPERLVFTHAWENEDGQPAPETIVTVTLTDQDGKTRMRFHQAVFESTASRDGHADGWSQSFDRLQDYLSGSKP